MKPPIASSSLHSRRSAPAVLALLCRIGLFGPSPASAEAAAGAAATCPWMGSNAPVADRVTQVLAQMTLDEKIALVHGVGGDPYAGRVPALPRLCLPTFVLHDGPNGVAGEMAGVTLLPAPVAAAATWDPALLRAYGAVQGAEQKAKGAAVALAPMVNIVRDPRFGRAFETYGEDPYLAGQLGAANVQGIQSQGVLAQVKHLAVYNQETNRHTPADDATLDERTLQEIYLPHFETAIREAGAASVMCSYNLVNGVHACENAHLLTEVLRSQWGFDGFVTSDWGATHSTVAAANNGLDMEMPTGRYFGEALKQAVQSGQVTAARLEEMVRRILTPLFRFGLIDRPLTGDPKASVTTPDHAAVARQVATQGVVLLKNAGSLLPLGRQRSIAVIGRPAHAEVRATGGLGNPVAAPSPLVTPYEAIRRRAGSAAAVTYAPGPSVDGSLSAVPADRLTPEGGAGRGLTARFYAGPEPTGTPLAARVDSTVDFDWHAGPPAPGLPRAEWSAAWSGTLTPTATGTHAFSLTSDDRSRLFVDGRQLIDNWRDGQAHTATGAVPLTAGRPAAIRIEYAQGRGEASLRFGWQPPDAASPLDQAVEAARAAEVAVVFADAVSWEGYDLADIDLPGRQNELISAVARANPSTVVVVQTGSAVTLPWIDSVQAVLQAWYLGQDTGPALAALLFGDANPSGKLPVTFPKRLADVPANTPARWPGAEGKVQYHEGLRVGYRWYDANGIEPLFPFGHGLSYTTFALDDLVLSPRTADGRQEVGVSASLTNTGGRTGAEVVQVYVGFPAAAGEPPRQLKAFTKVTLAPGESRRVTFTLGPRAFSVWDSARRAWVVADGTYRIGVGRSSRDLPLQGELPLTASASTPGRQP